MTAGSKNVVLLVLNMALSDRIIPAGGRAYSGIADGMCSGEGEKKDPSDRGTPGMTVVKRF
jgi:hypothetical protein